MLGPMRAAAAPGRRTEAGQAASLIVYLGAAANGHLTGEPIRADGHLVTP